jgi:hypothetical protein
MALFEHEYESYPERNDAGEYIKHLFHREDCGDPAGVLGLTPVKMTHCIGYFCPKSRAMYERLLALSASLWQGISYHYPVDKTMSLKTNTLYSRLATGGIS